jgi:hypothetical protein
MGEADLICYKLHFELEVLAEKRVKHFSQVLVGEKTFKEMMKNRKLMQ